jgi:hypothetical protein
MIDAVDQILSEWRRTPFEYGRTDCLLSVGDYIAARGGLCVTDQFKGTYDDADGAAAIIEAHGGHAPLIDLTGWQQIAPAAAVRGDVVLITGVDAGEVLAAICTGDAIAGRTDNRTLFEVNRRFVKILNAWGCPNEFSE